MFLTQCERWVVAYGWAGAGNLQALQLPSCGRVRVKWGFVFQPVSPYSEKWPLCFHVPPLKQFSVLLRFCGSLSHNSGKYLSRCSSAMSLVVFEILTKCAAGAVVGTLVDFTAPCRQKGESIVETSSCPSERQFQCNKALSSMVVGVSRGMAWQNRGFSSSHWSWTRWNGWGRAVFCAPHLPPHPCKTLDLLQFPLQSTSSKSTCAETEMGIFGVKPAQARSKDEYKKPHYSIDWKDWLARCLCAQLVVDVVPYLSEKLNVCNLSCLHQQLFHT